MTTTSLTISYSQDTAATGDWLRLAQQPVTSNRLTSEDLAVMLALVQSGTSARAYKPANCEASVLADQVVADLVLKVWPSSLSITYSLTAALVTVGGKSALQEWHEFDLIIPMATSVELPYLCENITMTWQTPAYNRQGVEVERPTIDKTGNTLRLSSEVFGVLRVRCLALGWQHDLRFSWSKTDAAAITSLKPAVVASWAGGEERLELELPGCLEALLAFCPDGQSKRSRSMSTVDNDDDETVPVVYYSPCSGRMLTVRQERP